MWKQWNKHATKPLLMCMHGHWKNQMLFSAATEVIHPIPHSSAGSRYVSLSSHATPIVKCLSLKVEIVPFMNMYELLLRNSSLRISCLLGGCRGFRMHGCCLSSPY